jgi:hypothetical protein
MQRCDDSYGVIGELAQEALLSYAKLPFEPAGIAGETWCEDLCELLAWEDWGLLHRHETKPFARAATNRSADGHGPTIALMCRALVVLTIALATFR